MCTIKEKWESSSSNYQHTKSNILWEDWELSFCKLSVLIWAEDATRVCLVFRVALCGEKFSKKFIFWIIDVAWRNDAWSSFLLPRVHTDTIFLSPIPTKKVDSWYARIWSPCFMLMVFQLNLTNSFKDIRSMCN